ncbi:MAG: metallophosphoesterase [Magnetococcales bacterium]|nr:metallophosphoesterase [Magnetococcales bacterium]
MGNKQDKKQDKKHDNSKEPRFAVVLSDTDNDLRAVQYALKIVGVCDKQGEWRKGIHGIRVIHTGDWLNKWAPSLEMIDYFMVLERSAPKGCDLRILNGNHELEILHRVERGQYQHLGEKRVAFIRSRDLVHVFGNTLFLHGYPTLHLLRFLLQILEEKKPLNRFNDRVRKAFYEGDHALFRHEEGKVLMGNIKRARLYYHGCSHDGEKRNAKISKLLKELDIHTVVHGHRPNILVQKDEAIEMDTPGIRIVNNDNQPKKSLLGAAIVDRKGEVVFVNAREMYWQGGEQKFKKKIREILGVHS